MLQEDDRQQVFISRIIPGSPAALTRELCEDDIIVEIDGQAMVGVAGDSLVAALKGDKGSLVRMAVMRGEISRTVYMVRGNARDSLTPAIRTRGPTHTFESENKGQSSPPVRRTRTSNVGVNRVLSGRMSIGTPGSAISNPPSTLVGESQRTLQVCTRYFNFSFLLCLRPLDILSVWAAAVCMISNRGWTSR